MSLYIFDCEVSAKDWLFVFKNIESGEYAVIHNDGEAVREFMRQEPLLCGFNNKHYDNHILKGILAGFDEETIKAISDLIILREMNGWEIPELARLKVWFQSFDLMDDCQFGTSLKAFEAHMGIPIEETEVDFGLDRVWTREETERMIKYCKYDVDATELLFKIRKGYLRNKLTLGRQCGLDEGKALYMTNAKLTSAYLGAAAPPEERTDEREYRYPDRLLREYIPQAVFDFFDRMKDPDVSDEELYGGELEIMVGECPCTIAFGGIHGAIPTYTETAGGTRTIRNKDVASYYPNLVRRMGYCSRNVPSVETYAQTIDRRVEAKRNGDKDTANALKLVLNTTYGAMLNKHNDLYDPLMGRSVCITGQLFLLELAEHLVKDCETLRIIQLNTDGIMVSLDESDVGKWQEITEEWQRRTGFELEEDLIEKIIQKDVNNYIEVPVGKSAPKVKGGQLVRGVLTNGQIDFQTMGLPSWENLSGGAFKINNNAVVVSRAIIDWFVKGVPPEETVTACTELLDFQIIAKAGGKYTRCYQKIGGREVPAQKVNRVYATDALEYGTLYKIHAKTGQPAKIAGLPNHCAIDNDNRKMKLEQVDRDWYVRQAWKVIRDFRGIKPQRRDNRKINRMKKTALAVLEE